MIDKLDDWLKRLYWEIFGTPAENKLLSVLGLYYSRLFQYLEQVTRREISEAGRDCRANNQFDINSFSFQNGEWVCKSSKGDRTYQVDEHRCTCRDFRDGHLCKHIRAFRNLQGELIAVNGAKAKIDLFGPDKPIW